MTEGLTQGMGIDAKALLSGIVGGKIAANTSDNSANADSEDEDE